VQVPNAEESRATLDDEEILRRLGVVSGGSRDVGADERAVARLLGYPEYRERLLVGVMKPGESRDGRGWKRYQAFYRKYLVGVGEESALENPSIRKRRGSHHPKAVATVARQEAALSVGAGGARADALFHRQRGSGKPGVGGRSLQKES
jgi:hypothetical protein